MIEELAICTGCGFSGTTKDFKPTATAYKDLRCPECGTTSINTKQVNEAWKARGEIYAYGDNNTLNFQLYTEVPA